MILFKFQGPWLGAVMCQARRYLPGNTGNCSNMSTRSLSYLHSCMGYFEDFRRPYACGMCESISDTWQDRLKTINTFCRSVSSAETVPNCTFLISSSSPPGPQCSRLRSLLLGCTWQRFSPDAQGVFLRSLPTKGSNKRQHQDFTKRDRCRERLLHNLPFLGLWVPTTCKRAVAKSSEKPAKSSKSTQVWRVDLCESNGPKCDQLWTKKCG